MQHLIDQLEKLEGPDRELDWEIRKALYLVASNEKIAPHLTPNYTASIDCALTLYGDERKAIEALQAICAVAWTDGVKLTIFEVIRQLIIRYFRARAQGEGE